MADIYVNHTGSSTTPYDTEAKAATDIQVALDAAGNGDTVWVKADQDYVMDGVDQQAAQFDVDVNDNVAIKGYYLNTGDQDYGGAYYKDNTNGWAVIDGNSGAYHVFSAGDYEMLSWENLKFTNVGAIYAGLDLTPTVAKRDYFVQNCWMTGSRYALAMDFLDNPIVRDCKFTGSYPTGPGLWGIIYININANKAILIEDCEFDYAGTARAVYCKNTGMAVIRNNIFNITGSVSKVIEVVFSSVITNNVIYEGSGGAITTGLLLDKKGHFVYNNIIVGCTTSITDDDGIHFGGWNCLYNNGSDWTLREGDIQSDPQFMDATNGDFRLKPTSPCLNTGKPTPGSGYTSIGAWQRKSLLR